jgi:hypothetical protein
MARNPPAERGVCEQKLNSGEPAMDHSRDSRPGPPNPGRRAFLATAGASVTLPAVPALAQATAADLPQTSQPVYRETDHIRTFYERSRF